MSRERRALLSVRLLLASLHHGGPVSVKKFRDIPGRLP
jgi:hypothetical protein